MGVVVRSSSNSRRRRLEEAGSEGSDATEVVVEVLADRFVPFFHDAVDVVDFTERFTLALSGLVGRVYAVGKEDFDQLVELWWRGWVVDEGDELFECFAEKVE